MASAPAVCWRGWSCKFNALKQLHWEKVHQFEAVTSGTERPPKWQEHVQRGAEIPRGSDRTRQRPVWNPTSMSIVIVDVDARHFLFQSVMHLKQLTRGQNEEANGMLRPREQAEPGEFQLDWRTAICPTTQFSLNFICMRNVISYEQRQMGRIAGYDAVESQIVLCQYGPHFGNPRCRIAVKPQSDGVSHFTDKALQK